MKLFHLTSEVREARILDRGFSDENCITDTRHNAAEDEVVEMVGVMFDDSEDCEAFTHDGVFLDSLRLAGRSVVSIDIPDDVAVSFQVFDDRHPERDHWTIPPEVATKYIARSGNQ